MESVGFKEWALVCAALESGDQSILIRKGGIAEGRDGFSFKHRAFYLFPTWFHGQADRLRLAPGALRPGSDGEIEIRQLARVQSARHITDWNRVARLEPLHVLGTDVVRERFGYTGDMGIHVALVRVFRLRSPWILPDERRFGGCRSWVQLPAPPAGMTLEPVLEEEEHARRAALFERITAGAGGDDRLEADSHGYASASAT